MEPTFDALYRNFINNADVHMLTIYSLIISILVRRLR